MKNTRFWTAQFLAVYINMEPEVESTTEENPQKEEEPEALKTRLAFFVFGFLLYAVYSLIISGAQDILMGTLVPTSAVLVANIGPYFIVSLIAPYFIQKITYLPRVIAVFLLYVAGLFMVVVGNQVSVKLLGVALCSFAFGLGELSFVAMTAFYHQTAIGAFSAGTGFGISLAPLYYTGKPQQLAKHTSFAHLGKYCYLGRDDQNSIL